VSGSHRFFRLRSREGVARHAEHRACVRCPTYSLAGYARSAIDAGAEIAVAAPTPTAGDKWLAEMIPEAPIYTFRTYGRGAFLASTDLQSWLRRNGARFDVVHIHGLLNPVSSLAARLCVQRRWPVVIRPFGTLSRYTYAHRRGTLKQLYRWLLDRPNLQRVSAVHFTTIVERTESEWQKIAWGTRACVIPPPWIDGSHNGGPRLTPGDSETVLSLSRLHPVKRVERLFDAWPAIRQRHPNARLVIAGDGEPAYVAKLRARANSLGDSVSFVGYVEGEVKRALLHHAQLFVLPSQHENFGIAVLEALASGLPVVISPEVQLSSFVSEHSLGIVSETSAPALADAIAGALEDRVLRERCRKQGPALVSCYFSPHAIGAQLLDMYRYATSHPPA
jgi:glycosyltransferase involved in cell wall biosynthesis